MSGDCFYDRFTFKNVDWFVCLRQRVHCFFNCACWQSAVLDQDFKKVLVVNDFKPRVLLAFDLIKLGYREVDADLVVCETLQDDSMLPVVCLRTALDEHISVSRKHIDYVIRILTRF